MLLASLKRAQGEGHLVLGSSSPRRSRSFKRQGPYVATAAYHEAQLPIVARTAGYASASTFQGSTGPHLRDVSGLHALDGARVHLTATFACHFAC